MRLEIERKWDATGLLEGLSGEHRISMSYLLDREKTFIETQSNFKPIDDPKIAVLLPLTRKVFGPLLSHPNIHVLSNDSITIEGNNRTAVVNDLVFPSKSRMISKSMWSVMKDEELRGIGWLAADREAENVSMVGDALSQVLVDFFKPDALFPATEFWIDIPLIMIPYVVCIDGCPGCPPPRTDWAKFLIKYVRVDAV